VYVEPPPSEWLWGQALVQRLEVLAGVAAGSPAGAERALRLAGAASAMRDRPGPWRIFPASQRARERLERWIAPARAALVPAAAEAMSVDEAIAAAREGRGTARPPTEAGASPGRGAKSTASPASRPRARR
jgi:hypothetical protein